MTHQIVIITVGTRGDVQPFVALGHRLQMVEGYRVRLATHRIFESFVKEWGMEFAPIAGDPRELIEMSASDKAGANLIRFIQQLSEWSSGFMVQALRDMWEAAQGADLIVFGFLGIMSSFAAEKLDIPAVAGMLIPIYTPTRDFSAVTNPVQLPIGLYNYWSHHLERTLAGFTMREEVNRWRQEIGLPKLPLLGFPFDKIQGEPVPYLYAFSPQVIPQPTDWPSHSHITGYWFLDGETQWTPPPILEAFIHSDDPPVYVGFGSLIDSSTEGLSQMIVDAARMAGKRLLLLSGWAGLERQTLSDDVLVIESAPHDWLFPKMAAVVHHGGAGTTAAGLRAGVPSVIVPFFGDQPFWAKQVQKIGAGVSPFAASKLNSEQLADAIRQATENPQIAERAADIGQQIRQEDGIGRAVRMIQSVLD